MAPQARARAIARGVLSTRKARPSPSAAAPIRPPMQKARGPLLRKTPVTRAPMASQVPGPAPPTSKATRRPVPASHSDLAEPKTRARRRARRATPPPTYAKAPMGGPPTPRPRPPLRRVMGLLAPPIAPALERRPATIAPTPRPSPCGPAPRGRAAPPARAVPRNKVGAKTLIARCRAHLTVGLASAPRHTGARLARPPRPVVRDCPVAPRHKR